MRKHLVSCVLLLFAATANLCVPTYSSAADAATGANATPAQWNVRQLMQRMAETPASRARFTEKKYSSLTKTPLVSSGTLSYTRPDRIAKQVQAPQEESLSVDGDVLTIENKSKNQRHSLTLQSYPVIWAFVESLRATLSGNLSSLQRFYKIRLDGGQQSWLLWLEPTDAQMAGYVQSILIRGADNRIASIEIHEAGGDRSVMAITPEVQ